MKEKDILEIVPEEEGKTHINAYSKSKISLGKLLSNFAHTPFSCEDGNFESIEGYWYWLSCEESDRRDELRKLHGYAAKKLGRDLRGGDYPKGEDFQRKIKRALHAKVYDPRNAKLKRQLYESGSVPIVHYYDYKGNIKVPEDGKWICAALSDIRREIQEKQFVVIVAGSRYFNNEALLFKYLDAFKKKFLDRTLVILSGGAKGADSLGEKWARENEISCKVFPADWDKHGKAAGPIRNKQMAEYADALILFWDGKSRGSKHMLDTAKELGLKTKVIMYEE
jgi:hypothetical protein